MYIYLPSLKLASLNESICPHLFSLRPKLEQVFIFTDLNGSIRSARIYKIDKKSKSIDLTWIGESITKAAPESKIMIQAIPEKLYLEKLIEILPHTQVTELYLYYAHRSLQQSLALERLHKILIRSCEQAQNVFLPRINLVSDNDQLHSLLVSYSPIVLEASEQANTADKADMSSNKAVLVGPEGGFSDFELDKFGQLGLSFYSLGEIVYPSWLAGFSYFEQIK
jgi:RsmE family RNA methyltransferase